MMSDEDSDSDAYDQDYISATMTTAVPASAHIHPWFKKCLERRDTSDEFYVRIAAGDHADEPPCDGDSSRGDDKAASRPDGAEADASATDGLQDEEEGEEEEEEGRVSDPDEPHVSHNGWESVRGMLDADDDQSFLSEQAKVQADPEKALKWVALLDKVGITQMPYTHQRVAIGWWVRKEGTTRERRAQLSGGIEADEMGLGKTFIAIASTLLCRHADQYTALPSSDAAANLASAHKVLLPPTLVVCPKGLVRQWQEEIRSKTKVHHSRVHVFYEAGASASADDVRGKVFVITTFGTVTAKYNQISDRHGNTLQPVGRRGTLHDIMWDRIIVDEAHRIKNRDTKTSKAVINLRSNRRWALTGTPFNNRMADLAALCQFIGVMPYYDDGWWRTATWEEIKKWRSDFLLRRRKAVLDLPPLTEEVIEVDMTEREHKFYATCEVQAMANYEGFLQSHGRNKSVAFQELLTWLLKLRQACCDPLLPLGRSVTFPFATQSMASKERFSNFCIACDSPIRAVPPPPEQPPPAAPEDKPISIVVPRSAKRARTKKPRTKKDDYFRLACGHVVCRGCGKESKCTVCKFSSEQGARSAASRLGAGGGTKADSVTGVSSRTRALLDILRKELTADPTTKVVVFSQWTSYLDLIEGAITHGLRLSDDSPCAPSYARMDGDVSSIDRRNDIVGKFCRDPRCRIFLTSLQAGGLGLNLVCANVAVVMDPWYNPFVERQAIDRIHRIGQKRPVRVYRIITNTGVDKAVMRIHQSKMEHAEACLHGKIAPGMARGGATGLNERELRSVFADLIENRKVAQEVRVAAAPDAPAVVVLDD